MEATPQPQPAVRGASQVPEGLPQGRLTPLDIQRKTFTRKRIGGIEEEEVYRFLTQVAKEHEHLIQETRRAKEQVLRHQKQLSDYMDLERTLKQTLQSAQRSTNESRVHAEKEAALILKQAELDGERVVEQAREEARQLMEEVRELKKAKRQLRIELKTVLEGFQDLLGESDPRRQRPKAPASAPPKAPARQAPPRSQPPKPPIQASTP